MRQAIPSAQIDALFAPWDSLASPGCALAVMHAGQVVYARGYGSANLEQDLPITPRSIFVAGAVAKQFTAYTIFLLARDGLLSLDDPLRAYVPEAPAYCDPVTLRHLLHHTSGLRDHWILLHLTDRPADGVYTEDDILDLLHRQQDLVTAPGTAVCYSNPGYILLAMAVRRASGRTFRAFTEERIFAPLGMRDTHVHDDHRQLVLRRADAYEPAAGGGYRLWMPHGDLVGNGGLMTTVEDLARWDAGLAAGALGGAEVAAQLQTPGRLAGGEAVRLPLLEQVYAGGLLLGTYRGLPIVHHPGANTGYRAQLLRFPAQQLAVACLCNLSTMDPVSLAFQVAELYLEDEMGAPAADPPPPQTLPDRAPSVEQRAACPGRYHGLELGTIYSVLLEQEGLLLRTPRGRQWPLQGLEGLGADEFAVEGLDAGRLRFVREEGTIVGFVLSADRAANLLFRKQEA